MHFVYKSTFLETSRQAGESRSCISAGSYLFRGRPLMGSVFYHTEFSRDQTYSFMYTTCTETCRLTLSCDIFTEKQPSPPIPPPPLASAPHQSAFPRWRSWLKQLSPGQPSNQCGAIMGLVLISLLSSPTWGSCCLWCAVVFCVSLWDFLVAVEQGSKMLTSLTDSCGAVFLYSYTGSMACHVFVFPPLWLCVCPGESHLCLVNLLVSLLRVSNAPLSLCFPCVLSGFILDCAMLLLPL